MNNYNPFYEIFKDNRLILDEKDLIKDTILLWGHLEPLDIIVCPKCGSNNVIKHGTKERKITEKMYREYKTELYLTIQKFRCKECASMFQDKTSIVDDNCNLTKRLIRLILEELRNDITETLVAKLYDTTPQNVCKIFREHVKVKRHSLPEVLCIDEFMNFGGVDGSFACIIYDPINRLIIDIIEDRRKPTLFNYFDSISVTERANVKYIVSDMYEGYRTVKKVFFPKATHVVDAFHYARYVTDALDSVRVNIQKQLDTKSKEYKLYKRYWELFLKSANDIIGFTDYNPMSQKYESCWNMIRDACNANPIFGKAYSLKEDFFSEYNYVKFEQANDFINRIIALYKESEIEQFVEVAKTFANWKDEILNSFIRFGDKRLHNGYLEGMINKIKSIKKISYGYSNFYHFRNRLMFIVNPNEPISREKITLIPKNPRKKK